MFCFSSKQQCVFTTVQVVHHLFESSYSPFLEIGYDNERQRK